MSKSKVLVLGLALTLWFGAISPQAGAAEEKAKEKEKDAGKHVQLMFVQNAKEVVFADGKMTLKGVAPSTIFFADRPERIAGHLTTPAFLNEWDKGKDSFAKDPPNATLSIFDEKGVNYVVVEIMNPKLSGTDLTYDVKVLEGTPPAKGGINSLFIDWWTYYGPTYCNRNPYTGYAYCHHPGYWYRPPGWYY